MTVLQRIKALCDEKKITIARLEKILNFSNSSLRETETHPLAIRSDRLLQIANYFNVSTDYLLTGEDPSYSADERQLILVYRSMNEDGKEELSNYAIYLAAKAIYKKSDKAI